MDDERGHRVPVDHTGVEAVANLGRQAPEVAAPTPVNGHRSPDSRYDFDRSGDSRGQPDLCRARSGHEQLQAAGGAASGRLSRGGRFFAIVRLGEGSARRGGSRTMPPYAVDALYLPCQNASKRRDRARLIATEACRAAENGESSSPACGRNGLSSKSSTARPRRTCRRGHVRRSSMRTNRRPALRYRRRVVRARLARMVRQSSAANCATLAGLDVAARRRCHPVGTPWRHRGHARVLRAMVLEVEDMMAAFTAEMAGSHRCESSISWAPRVPSRPWRASILACRATTAARSTASG